MILYFFDDTPNYKRIFSFSICIIRKISFFNNYCFHIIFSVEVPDAPGLELGFFDENMKKHENIKTVRKQSKTHEIIKKHKEFVCLSNELYENI